MYPMMPWSDLSPFILKAKKKKILDLFPNRKCESTKPGNYPKGKTIDYIDYGLKRYLQNKYYIIYEYKLLGEKGVN